MLLHENALQQLRPPALTMGVNSAAPKSTDSRQFGNQKLSLCLLLCKKRETISAVSRQAVILARKTINQALDMVA